MSEPLADVVAEARRLYDLAERQGLRLRLLGGVAVRLRARGDLAPSFQRDYGDLDWVTQKGGSGAAQRFFSEAGYSPEVAFNALNGKERLLFVDDGNGRRTDVFVGAFRMCHEIPIQDRLITDPMTLPLAELLLTKLQIVELNRKDVADALALFADHDVADSDGENLNAARVAELCAADWGLWRTITANLKTCRSFIDQFELTAEQADTLRARIDLLLERIDRQEKTRKWRLRARIGERKRWYELPEEVDGGPG